MDSSNSLRLRIRLGFEETLKRVLVHKVWDVADVLNPPFPSFKTRLTDFGTAVKNDIGRSRTVIQFFLRSKVLVGSRVCVVLVHGG